MKQRTNSCLAGRFMEWKYMIIDTKNNWPAWSVIKPNGADRQISLSENEWEAIRETAITPFEPGAFKEWCVNLRYGHVGWLILTSAKDPEVSEFERKCVVLAWNAFVYSSHRLYPLHSKFAGREVSARLPVMKFRWPLYLPWFNKDSMRVSSGYEIQIPSISLASDYITHTWAHHHDHDELYANSFVTCYYESEKVLRFE